MCMWGVCCFVCDVKCFSTAWRAFLIVLTFSIYLELESSLFLSSTNHSHKNPNYQKKNPVSVSFLEFYFHPPLIVLASKPSLPNFYLPSNPISSSQDQRKGLPGFSSSDTMSITSYIYICVCVCMHIGWLVTWLVGWLSFYGCQPLYII